MDMHPKIGRALRNRVLALGNRDLGEKIGN
jgi:hypothetical protein